MPVRKALQLSLNVPAIALLDRVGSSRLSSRLKQAGANLVLPKDEAPGLAMGLGGVGVTLQDLVQLYAGLARLGTAKPLREIVSVTDDREPLRLMDQVAAWQVGNVLIGTPPPENAAHNRIAFKTGTSYGYRDAWSVGFDGKHHHRRLGRPARRRAGAGPGRAHRRGADPVRRLRPHRQTAGAAAEAAEGRAGRQQRQTAAAAAPVPPDRANWSAPAASWRRASSFRSMARGSMSTAPATGRLLGDAGQSRRRRAADDDAGQRRSVGEIDSRRQRLVDPPGPGFARLTVIDATGAADTVVDQNSIEAA